MNEFHRLGGYDAILKRVGHINDVSAAAGSSQLAGGSPSVDLLESLGSSDPLAEICTYAAIVFLPRYCYTQQWARTYYQPIRDVLLARVLKLTDGQV